MWSRCSHNQLSAVLYTVPPRWSVDLRALLLRCFAQRAIEIGCRQGGPEENGSSRTCFPRTECANLYMYAGCSNFTVLQVAKRITIVGAGPNGMLTAMHLLTKVSVSLQCLVLGVFISCFVFTATLLTSCHH